MKNITKSETIRKIEAHYEKETVSAPIMYGEENNVSNAIVHCVSEEREYFAHVEVKKVDLGNEFRFDLTEIKTGPSVEALADEPEDDDFVVIDENVIDMIPWNLENY